MRLQLLHVAELELACSDPQQQLLVLVDMRVSGTVKSIICLLQLRYAPAPEQQQQQQQEQQPKQQPRQLQ